MNINYHIHTPLCNHAVGSMPRYIREAVSLGLAEICFLDHLTLNPADRRLSMSLEEVPLYFLAARELAYQHREEIQVKVGLEIDFYPDAVELIETIVQTFDFDVIGCSVHFLGAFDIVSKRGDWRFGKGDTDEVYALYFKTMNQMLDHDFFDLICHFDLPKKYGRYSQLPFSEEIDRLLLRIKEKGVVVELNTSGYSHLANEAYPSPAILEKCFNLGIPISLGSDAHHPDQLISHYDQAERLFHSVGYTHLATFYRRCLGQSPIVPTGTKGIHEAVSDE
jgi:histidinol-phosphatase (PHP family)